MKIHNLIHKNKKVKAYTFKVGDQLWAHINGKTICYTEKSAAQKSNAQSQKSHLILAPMPGKISKVNASVGMDVESGQTLVVMEAMKMEYALKASISSKVEKVFFKPGDQVKLGDVLVELKKESSD